MKQSRLGSGRTYKREASQESLLLHDLASPLPHRRELDAYGQPDLKRGIFET